MEKVTEALVRPNNSFAKCVPVDVCSVYNVCCVVVLAGELARHTCMHVSTRASRASVTEAAPEITVRDES